MRQPPDGRLPRVVRLAASLFLTVGVGTVGLLGAAHIVPLPADFFEAPSTVVYYRDGAPAHIFLSPDDKLRVPVEDLSELDPKYIEALLQFEDRRFLRHGGVDLWAVARAAMTNLLHGRVVSGASTLSMQLVRMREPRKRTLASKLVEAFRALQLEARLDKEAILRAYATYVPFGGNLEGVPAASHAFFGHGPAHLSEGEIAVLLAVPQRPSPRHPSVRNRAHLERARDHVLRALDLATPIDPGEVPTRLEPVPRDIPHLAYALRARFPSKRRLHTTLDRATQALVEAVLRSSRPLLEERGIHNGAVVVAHHQSGEIRALAGSLNFWTDEHGGQIPGFSVPRSPGSALKPFIYGRAIEDGRWLPGTLVADVPRTYRGYQPSNYDGRFDGAVRAQEALARSLNLPFVDMLAEIGADRFIGELVSLGAVSIEDSPGRHGLSAAIGAIELTPIELAQLYAGVAEGGQVRPLRVLSDEPKSPALTMWSPGTAYLVRDALDDRDRPDFPHRAELRGLPSGIHWKTGTSFAHRDAWTAGSDAVHTVVVWLGNFDRSPSPHLVGADAAGPIFFDILDGLDTARPAAGPPKDLVRIEVCALTGRPVGPACPHRVDALALSHKVPLEGCTVHVHRFVDRRSGLSVRPGCRPSEHVERRNFEQWPADILRFMGPSARSLPAPPAPDPACAASGRGDAPRILAPVTGVRVLIPGLDPADQEIPLEGHGQGLLRWFVDGLFLGSAAAGERLWWTPRPGTHTIVMMDERGQRARRAVEVMRMSESVKESEL